ncbi:hypothetical protein STEG23_019513, partial [Scotinomys teguina]
CRASDTSDHGSVPLLAASGETVSDTTVATFPASEETLKIKLLSSFSARDMRLKNVDKEWEFRTELRPIYWDRDPSFGTTR